MQRENPAKTGLALGEDGVGWQSCREKLSPCSPSSPCPRDAHFYFSLWSDTWTHQDLAELPMEEHKSFPGAGVGRQRGPPGWWELSPAHAAWGWTGNSPWTSVSKM